MKPDERRRSLTTTARLMATLLLGGCVSARLFPLCPELVAPSYGGVAPTGSVVSRFVSESAQTTGVAIKPLSPFVVELAGSPRRIAWFERHYRFLLCGFHPSEITMDEEVFMTCTANAERWLTVVRSEAPDTLMARENRYAAVCIR